MLNGTSSGLTQGSGFETNTSASNIIDRWTREACAIIVRHNNRNSTDLPMPELPARAYCAGMASSCYVLKAVDVEMLMLPGVLKEDLRYLVCLHCEGASVHYMVKLLSCEPAAPLTFPLARVWHVITACCPVRPVCIIIAMLCMQPSPVLPGAQCIMSDKDDCQQSSVYLFTC